MPAAGTDVTVTPTREQDRPAIERILCRGAVFSAAEVDVALEVLDVYLYKLEWRERRRILRVFGSRLGRVDGPAGAWAPRRGAIYRRCSRAAGSPGPRSAAAG